MPFIVLLLGLLATAFSTWLLATLEAEKDRARFVSAVHQRHDAIKERLSTHIAMLRGVAGYMMANAQVQRYEFSAYVNALNLDEHYPGVLGIGYTQRVSFDAVGALERSQARQGYQNFQVWPDTLREEYHAIVYLEPMDERNEVAIGYDMYTEPVRAEAMTRARDTGEPALTGRVTLVQEIDEDKQAGFLIYVPVFSGLDAPATAEERRDRLKGFAYSPLRARDLFDTLFSRETPPMIALAIYDGEVVDPAQLLYRNVRSLPVAGTPFTATETMTVAGRPWTVQYRALPAFGAVSGSGLVPVVLVTGLILSFVVAGLSFMQARAQAAQRASARALQAYREAVHHEEKLYRLAVEQVRDYAIFLISPEGAMGSWNDGVQKVLGWGEQDFLGQPVEVTFPDEDKKAAEEELRLARERAVATNDRWQMRKDGTRFWASGVTNALYDEQGRFVGYLKVMRDLTESRLHQQAIEAHEKLLRLITDTLPVLLGYLDKEQRYRFTNRTYEQWFGRPRENLLGMHVRDLVGEDSYARQRPYIERALAGEAVHYTIQLPVRGLIRDLSITYSPDRADDGRVVGFAVLVEDITARKEAEERARTILESITDAFYAVDHEWRLTYVNRLAIEHFGKPAMALLGQSLWSLHPKLSGSRMEEEYRRAMREQQPVSFEWRSTFSERWMDVRAYPSAGGLSVYFRDITAEKAAQEERARQARTLAFMLELNQATTALQDPEEITAVAARMLGRYLDADRCAYAVVDEDEEHFSITGDYTRDVSSTVGRYRLSDFGADFGLALRTGRIYVQGDTGSLPTSERFAALGIRAVVCAPLVKGGRLVAGMAVHQTEPRVWTREEIEIVRLVASRCWEAIERAHIARNLRESEERFRQMANSMPQLAWIARPDGSIYWFNQRWYEYTGMTPEQVRDEGWRAFHHPSTLQSTLDAYYASVSSGEPFEMTTALKGRDGRYRDFLSRAVAVRDANGRIVQWFGTYTDVSGARAAEARFRAVVETTPEFVKIIGCDGRIQYVNGAGLAMLGVNALSEVYEQPLIDFIAPQHRTLWQANHERVCNGEQLVWQFEIVGLKGERYWVETHAVPITMADGEVSHLGVTRDITGAKRIEREREQIIVAERAARAEAERVVRMKDEFLATLSHELRTPLSAVLGWAQLLRRRAMSQEDTAAALEAIERNAKAQQTLIEDLLDMSRIVSGKVRLDVRPVHMPDVLDAALDVVRPMAEAKRIRLMHEVDRTVAPLNGDPSRLQQVLWNLLTNAIKFTPAGGEVTLRLWQEDSALQLQVADTGAGMSQEFLPHVFDRFRQFDSSTTRAHGGLGLGLAIVKSLVELHGGTVRAESAGEGKGATFSVVLPIPAVAATHVGLKREGSAHETQSSASLPDAPSLLGLKILAVDDEPDALALVRRILIEYGAQVTVAANADQALEALVRERYDLIISDIGMPNVDGYALIRRIRELPPEHGGRTPAIALTAFAREDDRRRALVAGFQLHLSKPVDPVSLVLACARMADVTAMPSGAGTG